VTRPGHARADLAAQLERGEPVTAERETLLAAVRAVWALAGRWRADGQEVAAAEAQDAIRDRL